MSTEALDKMTSAWLALVKQHLKLFWLEARLAKMSLPKLILASGLLIILLLNTWVFLLAAVYIVLYVITNNILLSLSLTFLFNLLVVTSTFLLMLKYLNKVKFNQTRRHLKLYLQAGAALDDQQTN